MRETFEVLERKLGQRTPEHAALELELPECMEYLWEWYCEISRSRTSGMSLNPITYLELAAWSQLTGTTPAPWEVSAIKAVDVAFLKLMQEE